MTTHTQARLRATIEAGGAGAGVVYKPRAAPVRTDVSHYTPEQQAYVIATAAPLLRELGYADLLEAGGMPLPDAPPPMQQQAQQQASAARATRHDELVRSATVAMAGAVTGAGELSPAALAVAAAEGVEAARMAAEAAAAAAAAEQHQTPSPDGPGSSASEIVWCNRGPPLRPQTKEDPGARGFMWKWELRKIVKVVQKRDSGKSDVGGSGDAAAADVEVSQEQIRRYENSVVDQIGK